MSEKGGDSNHADEVGECKSADYEQLFGRERPRYTHYYCLADIRRRTSNCGVK